MGIPRNPVKIGFCAEVTICNGRAFINASIISACVHTTCESSKSIHSLRLGTYVKVGILGIESLPLFLCVAFLVFKKEIYSISVWLE